MFNRLIKSAAENFDLQMLASSLIALVALAIGLRALAGEPHNSVKSEAKVEVQN